MLPPLLYFFAILFLTAAMVCAIWVVVDIRQYPQKIPIMNLVWPLTMLYLGPAGLFLYYLYGRNKPSAGRWLRRKHTPFWVQVLKSSIHCGAGCALGDFVGEWLAYAAGFDLFGSPLLGKLAACFLFAYLFGLAFQFYAMPPKRNRDMGKLLWRAVRIDSLSLAAYEIGVLAWMGLMQWLYPDLNLAMWDYWYMMQVAMVLGLATTYPVNLWLLKSGIKEAM